MNHVAIDLGGRKSQVCLRGEQGQILLEKEHETNRLGSFLAQQPRSRVILEASAEAFAIADAAREHGHDVRVVSAHLVRELGVGDRGVKTDRRDAQKLSEVSSRIDLPSIHIPSRRGRELKAMCGMRDALVQVRTLLINTVRGWLRTQVSRIATGSASTFPTRVRNKLLQSPNGIPQHLERVLLAIEALTVQLTEASKEVEEVAQDDPVCQRLMSVPGVGAVTSLRFLATLDVANRFGSAAAVRSYLGLTPGENSSSTRVRRTCITKAGSPDARRTLIQACWVAIRYRPDDPMVRWAKQIAERRGKCVAVVALARKMAGILFALWRDGTRYDPARGATLLT